MIRNFKFSEKVLQEIHEADRQFAKKLLADGYTRGEGAMGDCWFPPEDTQTNKHKEIRNGTFSFYAK